MLQRRLHIGHNQAAYLQQVMERLGLIGPEIDFHPREVLIGRQVKKIVRRLQPAALAS